MKDEAYSTYIQETESWLHKGRKKLIYNILKRIAIPSNSVEILEVGAGVGQNIGILTNFGIVDALEINSSGLASLRGMPYIRNVIDKPIFSKIDKEYDIICAFDVVEHIEKDKASIKWILNNLKPGGFFIATVPAFQWFFSSHDVSLEHFRRYDAKSFRMLLPNNSEIMFDGYFNMILFPVALVSRVVWDFKKKFLSRKNTGKQKIPQNSFIDRIFFKILTLESYLISLRMRLPYGLSYYICIKKIGF